jgi:hypothetical protein
VNTHRLRFWLVWLVVGLALVGWTLPPLVAVAHAAEPVESDAVAAEPSPTPPLPYPGDGRGTNGFSWGG